MQFLILGDVHAGKGSNLAKTGVSNGINSRIVDQINLLDWTLEQAVENCIGHIIVTGDVFEDPKPTPSIISIIIEWLKKCSSNSVSVHIIVGNHDILRIGNFYDSPLDIVAKAEIENVFVYKDIATIYINSVAITLLPFRDRKSFFKSSNSEALSVLNNIILYEQSSIPLPFTKVLIGHLALEGSIPVGDEIDDVANELYCPLSMFSNYDYVWMGHVHKHQVLSKKPYIAHIGSMDISNFGESDQKKVIVIFDTENLTFSEKELPTRPLKKILITIPKDIVDTTRFVKEEIEKHSNLNKSIVKIELSLSSNDLAPVDRNQIEESLYKLGVFNVSSISESKKINSVKKSTESIDSNIDTSSAIKMWADLKYPSKEDEVKKNKYLEKSIYFLNKLKSET